MSSTNNTASTSTPEVESSINTHVNKHGLRTLLGAHQSLVDVMSRHSNVYLPLIYDPPREIRTPTPEERRTVEAMLHREMEIVQKLKKLLENLEANYTDLIHELSPWSNNHTGWATDN